MFRAVRIAVVVLLSAAIASVPLILDQCAATCEMHRDSVARAPACHHGGATSARLGQTPGTCGHDHTGTTVAADNGSRDRVHSAAPAVAVVMMRLNPAMAAGTQSVHTHAPPGTTSPLDHRSLALRL